MTVDSKRRGGAVALLGLALSFGLSGACSGGDSGAPKGGNSSSGGSQSTSSGGSQSTSSGGSGNVPSNCTPDYECEPEVMASSGDPHVDCVDRVNQFRACVCLPPLERWTDGEACADQQAEYDSTRTPHAGFSEGICDSGFGQNECPGWGDVDEVIDGCVQMMFDEGPPPSESCEGQCFSDHGHFLNITGDYSRVACGFFETPDGEVWSVQNYK